METNTSAPPIAVRSRNPPRLTAERIPIGIPSSSQRKAAPTVSEIVAGSRSLIRPNTEAPE